MALEPAVMGQDRGSQRVHWWEVTGREGTDLTGATLTGKKRERKSGALSAITGTLTLDPTVVDEFVWAYSILDVAVAGTYEVQFTATYPDLSVDRTFITTWEVRPAL